MQFKWISECNLLNRTDGNGSQVTSHHLNLFYVCIDCYNSKFKPKPVQITTCSININDREQGNLTWKQNFVSNQVERTYFCLFKLLITNIASNCLILFSSLDIAGRISLQVPYSYTYYTSSPTNCLWIYSPLFFTAFVQSVSINHLLKSL